MLTTYTGTDASVREPVSCRRIGQHIAISHLTKSSCQPIAGILHCVRIQNIVVNSEGCEVDAFTLLTACRPCILNFDCLKGVGPTRTIDSVRYTRADYFLSCKKVCK